jgi:N-acetylmuramoyl-L-alanine amidase
MQADRNQPGWQAQPFLLYLLRRNLALLLYFVVAAAGMVGVYWFFQPESGATAAAVSAAGDETSLSAAIFKKVPARPVLQRFAQTPGPLHIALIAGHKDHDSGAVCDDGLTEAAVNLIIAEKVQALLLAANIRSEIFAEFDPRLNGYSGTALVSLHADSCNYINDLATGFKLSGSSLTDSSQLSTCVEAAYAEATGLPYHPHTITLDMQDYHAFREIAWGVPAVILETGFMNLDRELLTTRADVPAAGIAQGILCFLEGAGR